MLFPGQGSQFVGMGKLLLEYPNVRDIYKLASKILGYDLIEVCLKGPKSLLDKTLYCQPAVVVTSLAAIEKLKYDNPKAIESCITTAGYSVGEISALVFAGSLSIEDAIYLVKYRSEAMQKVSEGTPGSMMVVFISPSTKLNFACHASKLYCKQELKMEEVVCEISNYLHPGCKVVAGNSQALKFIEKNAKEFEIRRTSYLPVSGAFHSKLMQPVVEMLKSKISSLKINDPVVPVHSNVTGARFKNADDIRKLILKQICMPVKWEQTLHSIYARPQGKNFPRTFEVGPGKQMGALLKMVNAKAFEEYQNVDV
ncbi:hypothetical protein HELRODRAFT_185364 [Helobdella robusta]|uniref:[acyl-carrier-protein] S-malonyltransferase n=1 Tax=Helobdella robusta TaxID=6412 RepID=T1FMQ4_HELRO|nr:hypothetical protein HELRODRAFT_185364 [Helobdella robusta]ESO08719.1 hypothetical protein HELRODRAFT_185364 [Helobdella robusta]